MLRFFRVCLSKWNHFVQNPLEQGCVCQHAHLLYAPPP